MKWAAHTQQYPCKPVCFRRRLPAVPLHKAFLQKAEAFSFCPEARLHGIPRGTPLSTGSVALGSARAARAARFGCARHDRAERRALADAALEAAGLFGPVRRRRNASGEEATTVVRMLLPRPRAGDEEPCTALDRSELSSTASRGVTTRALREGTRRRADAGWSLGDTPEADRARFLPM